MRLDHLLSKEHLAALLSNNSIEINRISRVLMDGILTCESEKQIFLVLPLNAWKRLFMDLVLGTLLGPEGTKVRFWA